MIRNCSEMNVQECWMPFYTLFQLISAHKVLGSYDLFPSYSILNMYIQIMISKELHELYVNCYMYRIFGLIDIRYLPLQTPSTHLSPAVQLESKLQISMKKLMGKVFSYISLDILKYK